MTKTPIVRNLYVFLSHLGQVPFSPLQSPSVPFSPLHSIGYPPPKLQCCRQGTARELERARPAPEVEIQLYQICKFHKDHPPTHVLVDPARWLEDYFPQKSWLLSARCGMVSGFKISLSQYLVRLLLTLPNWTSHNQNFDRQKYMDYDYMMDSTWFQPIGTYRSTAILIMEINDQISRAIIYIYIIYT